MIYRVLIGLFADPPVFLPLFGIQFQCLSIDPFFFTYAHQLSFGPTSQAKTHYASVRWYIHQNAVKTILVLDQNMHYWSNQAHSTIHRRQDGSTLLRHKIEALVLCVLVCLLTDPPLSFRFQCRSSLSCYSSTATPITASTIFIYILSSIIPGNIIIDRVSKIVQSRQCHARDWIFPRGIDSSSHELRGETVFTEMSTTRRHGHTIITATRK